MLHPFKLYFHPWSTHHYIDCRVVWMITDRTNITENGLYFFITPKHQGVLRVYIGYLVVVVNRSELDFVNLTQMWRKILICNEFTFNVVQYFFAMFCFHPASTISTQHPLLCREISTKYPDPFHPASRRKIGFWYLTFRSMPRLYSSHIAVNLKF